LFAPKKRKNKQTILLSFLLRKEKNCCFSSAFSRKTSTRLLGLEVKSRITPLERSLAEMKPIVRSWRVYCESEQYQNCFWNCLLQCMSCGYLWLYPPWSVSRIAFFFLQNSTALEIIPTPELLNQHQEDLLSSRNKTVLRCLLCAFFLNIWSEDFETFFYIKAHETSFQNIIY
jgi:hypothetical protein